MAEAETMDTEMSQQGRMCTTRISISQSSHQIKWGYKFDTPRKDINFDHVSDRLIPLHKKKSHYNTCFWAENTS